MLGLGWKGGFCGGKGTEQGAGRCGPGELGGRGSPCAGPPAATVPRTPSPGRPLPNQESGAPGPSSGRWVCSVQGCDTQGGGPPSGRTWGIPHMSPPPVGLWDALATWKEVSSGQGWQDRAHGNWVTI